MAFVHRLWLKKREDTFELSRRHQVWFNRGASTLPTGSRSTNPGRGFPAYSCTNTVLMMRFNQALLHVRTVTSPRSSSRRFSCRGLVPETAKMRSVSVHSVTCCARCLPLCLCFFSHLQSRSVHRAKCQTRQPLQNVSISVAPGSAITSISDNCPYSSLFHTSRRLLV